MAIPTKKIYGRNGKLMFDPSNPEDVRNYKEKQPLMEALKLVQGLTDPRTGGGLTGATRIISRAANAKIAKTKFAQNKAKQILELVTKPMTKGKKTTPTVKEVVETTPDIPTTVPTSGITVPDKIKSLYDQLVSGKPKQSGILESVKNVRELVEKQVKTAPTTTTTAPVKKALTREEMKVYNQKIQKATNIAKEIVDNKKFKTELEKLREANKPFYEKSINEAISKSNKKIAIGTGIAGGLTAAGGVYYGMQSTGPVDLKRIDNSKLRPSKVEGVSIVKGSDGKDYGIKYNDTTKSWDYYRENNKPVVKPIIPKETIKEDTGGGGVTPIKNDKNKGTGTGGGNNQKTTTGGGGGIKTPVKPTVTPTTSTYVGDEYYKANPDLEKAIQEDSIRQQREMYLEKIATKPLSSIVFKPTSKAVDVRNVMDEQDALRSIRADNKLPLKKKKYGGNLAMLKYMK
jgi:hypothetical protein